MEWTCGAEHVRRDMDHTDSVSPGVHAPQSVSDTGRGSAWEPQIRKNQNVELTFWFLRTTHLFEVFSSFDQ